MARKVLQEYGSAAKLFAVGAAVLGLVLGLRYGALEAGIFPSNCGATLGESVSGVCVAKWLLIQTFMQQRLGWLSLVLGLAAFALNRRPLAWGGWVSGLAGLVLYSFDLSAVGAVLSLIVLARGTQIWGREQEASNEPGDSLRVGRLG